MNVYDMVTNKIIAKLEEGVIPWRCPWKQSGPPRNIVTKKPYRGVNVLLLSMQGYGSPYYLTYNQARQMGGTVKKFEKATPVVLWKWVAKKEDGSIEEARDGDADKIPILRYYSVFNLEQTDGIYPPDEEEALIFNPVEKAEAIAIGYRNGPAIEETGDQACYVPGKDVIQIPRKEKFVSVEEYYSTLFHEMTHSTGAASRLNRHKDNESHRFASEDYSREELVAELGASFLSNHAGISTAALETNSAAYIQNWLGVLKADKRMIVYAASAAQKAADYILGNKLQET